MESLIFYLALFISLITGLIAANIFNRKKYIVSAIAMGFFLIFFVLIPFFNSLLQYNYIEQTEAVLGPITSSTYFLTFSIYSVIFTSLGLIFSLILRKQNVDHEQFSPFQDHELKTVLNITALFQFIGLILFLSATGYQSLNLVEIAINIVDGGRFNYFKNPDYNELFMTLSHYFNHSCVLYFFFDIRSRTPSKIRTLLVSFMVILIVFFTGSRGFILSAISGAAMGIYLYRKMPIFISIVIGSFILVFMIVFQIIRRSWSTDIGFDEIIEVLVQGDMTYFYAASLEALRQFHEGYQFYPFNFIRQLLFLPIPGEFTFGLKQADLPMLFEQSYHYNYEVRSGNFPPGLIGVFVLNFGLLGPVLGPLIFFIFVTYFDKCYKKRGFVSEAFLAVAFILVLQLFRGAMMGFYFWFFLSLMLIFIKFSIILWRSFNNVTNISRP